MSQFMLLEKAATKRLYAGGELGWVGGIPPEPPKPEDQAMKFDTKDAAQKYADDHGMKADPVPASPPEPPEPEPVNPPDR